MSPQSALNANRASFVATRKKSERRVSMSNSELTQAANAAFSLHKRLDSDLEQTNTTVNPLNDVDSSSTCRIQPRKRKVSLESVPAEDKDRFSADFLSGIFDDLAKAQSMEGSDHNDTPTPHTDGSTTSRKKPRRCMSRSMSYFSVHNAQNNAMDGRARSTPSDSDSMKPPSPNDCAASFQGTEVTEDLASNPTSDCATCNNAAAIVDQVFSSGLIFPNLPVSISDSSCSSNNLTQTSVQAVQVLEKPQLIEGEMQDKKDGYGWFVEMDDEGTSGFTLDTNAVGSSSSQKDLAFVAATAPKQDVNYEDEVQWAKAADTVDDVLGDFF